MVNLIDIDLVLCKIQWLSTINDRFHHKAILILHLKLAFCIKHMSFSIPCFQIYLLSHKIVYWIMWVWRNSEKNILKSRNTLREKKGVSASLDCSNKVKIVLWGNDVNLLKAAIISVNKFGTFWQNQPFRVLATGFWEFCITG